MQKKDWIQQINLTLNTGVPFVYSSCAQSNSQLIFACDTFRRKKHDVIISIEPAVNTQSILTIVIHPFQNCIDFTVTKKTTCDDILAEISKNTCKLRVRGCGTTIDTVQHGLSTMAGILRKI